MVNKYLAGTIIATAFVFATALGTTIADGINQDLLEKKKKYKKTLSEMLF